MKSSDLVRMANQITDFFGVYPKPEALDGVAKHIHNTWEPRMRDELKEILESGGKGLNPLCIEAMTIYFQGPKSDGRRSNVKPGAHAPMGGKPSFAEGGGDAG